MYASVFTSENKNKKKINWCFFKANAGSVPGTCCSHYAQGIYSIIDVDQNVIDIAWL